MRVYHVAQESGLASRVLLQMLHARGIEMPSHMAILTEDQSDQLSEAIQSLRGGGSIAPKPEPEAPAPEPAVPQVVENAPPGSVPPGTLVGRRKKTDEDDARKPAPSKRRKKAGDEKRQELSEELLREGLQEVRNLGSSTGEAQPPNPTAIPPKPGAAPPVPPRRMPTRPVPQTGPGGRALSRLQQRRAPRTLVRQRRRGKQAP
ncbi:MAG: translation initiation factor IF-2 N-terminal domain-containing protein, partial [Planctomycetota bacterium]